jgi:hypothetical protein
LSKEAFEEWQVHATKEAEALLSWYNRLPEYNGFLHVSVPAAKNLKPIKKGYDNLLLG